MTETRRSNLQYLSSYRRAFPKGDTLADDILAIASREGVRLIDLADSVEGGFVSAMPVILHLVWHRFLEADLDERLSEHTLVRAADAEPVMLTAAA